MWVICNSEGGNYLSPLILLMRVIISNYDAAKYDGCARKLTISVICEIMLQNTSHGPTVKI